jgi:hypothetical protein
MRKPLDDARRLRGTSPIPSATVAKGTAYQSR